MKKINLILENFDKLNISDIEKSEEHTASLFVINRSILYFQSQSQGLNLSQQRESLKIMDKIDGYKENTIEFEDSEYIFLKNIFSTVKWPENIRLFVSVADNIENPIVEKETTSE